MSERALPLRSGEFDALAAARLEGRATDEQAARLGAMVEASRAARDRLLGLADLHSCLTTDAGLWAMRPIAPRDAPARRGLSVAWAAAAGVICLACGLLGASVWAMNSPQLVATVGEVASFADGGFEASGERLPSGFPARSGRWSGDQATIVDGGKLRPAEGRRLLRFDRAEREPGLPDRGAASCDVYQLVDLRSLKAKLDGDAALELAVRFCDARTASNEEPIKFICRLYVFAGAPDAIGAEWPSTQKESLAAGSGSFDSTGGAAGVWHDVATKVLLPPQADFAVVHLVAHKPTKVAGSAARFGEQFADDVRLTFKTQPVLPVRPGRN